MSSLLIIIIYLAFISLGLPDSLLGTAWPLMRIDFNSPMEAAGLVSMMISGCTIISTFSTGYILKWLDTGKLVLISCIMTASALLGFSMAPSIIWLFILAIPLGLGAGAVDASLNSYVAYHYKSYHMNWLHCFWGVGASLGPLILSYFMRVQNSWRNGYLTVSGIQFALVALFLVSLPLWKRNSANKEEMQAQIEGESAATLEDSDVKTNVNPIKIKGVIFAILTFLFYVSGEVSMGLWGSSFLVNIKGIAASTAAQWISLYYSGITIGRLISGFISIKVSNPAIIRLGIFISLTGIILIILPLPSVFTLLGCMLLGLGFAPIFPSMIHQTPINFGKEHAQKIIGWQMSFSYMGNTFLTPLLGAVAARTTIGILPYCILGYILMVFLCTERINFIARSKESLKTTEQ